VATPSDVLVVSVDVAVTVNVDVSYSQQLLVLSMTTVDAVKAFGGIVILPIRRPTDRKIQIFKAVLEFRVSCY